MHLDHDHRERENVGSFGKSSLIQDLWSGPLHVEPIFSRIILGGILAFDGGTRKTCDECMTEVIHNYIQLPEWLIRQKNKIWNGNVLL